MIPDANEQSVEIVKLFDTKRMNFDKILVKTENKKECKIMKEYKIMKDRNKVSLYTGENKEVKLNEDGLFDEYVDAMIHYISLVVPDSVNLLTNPMMMMSPLMMMNPRLIYL